MRPYRCFLKPMSTMNRCASAWRFQRTISIPADAALCESSFGVGQRYLKAIHRKSAKVLVLPTKTNNSIGSSIRTAATMTLDDPRAKPKTYSVRGASRSKNKGAIDLLTQPDCQTISLDLPLAMGGKATAAGPVETLLGALAACTQSTAMYVAKSRYKIIIDRMHFELTATRDERGALGSRQRIPARVQLVTGTVTIHAKHPVTSTQMRELAEQTEKRCPIADMMLASGCTFDVDWIDGSDG